MPDLSDIRTALNDADFDDRVLRRIFADAFDGEGTDDPRGMVLRHACAVHEQIGNITLPDRTEAFWTESEGWATVATELETLATHPEDTPAFRDRYQRLVRGDIPLDPESLEPTLRLQYDLQVRLLKSLNLLEGPEDNPFITAIDGTRYPLPAFEDVLANIQKPETQAKLTQGFDTLLLVPFGLPLDRFLVAWQQGLRRNTSALQAVGGLNTAEPLWIWEGYRTETLVYGQSSFARQHGGRTKDQVLARDNRGWDVLLVEGALSDLPLERQGQCVGCRTQFESGNSPEEYLREIQGRDETGLTPESYVVHFLDTLERRGQVLDVETYTFLTGAFLPASRYVPGACWVLGGGQANLAGRLPDSRSPAYGVRAAVRINQE